MERNFDNVKDVMCVVTYIEDPMKTFEENNMLEYVDEEEAKYTLKKKIIGLALKRYIDRKEKLKKI